MNSICQEMSGMALPHERATFPILRFAKTAIIMVALVLLLGVGVTIQNRMVSAAERSEAVSHCRKIIIGLRLFSSNCAGNYPNSVTASSGAMERDVLDSNEAFRELFKGGYLEAKDEMLFGCPHSPFKPDGEIGKAPLYLDALAKGENHWALTAGLYEYMPGDYPLVFENPADANNPPRWNADAAGKAEPGRCWPGGSVVVGFNDCTVRWMPLKANTGSRVELQPPPRNRENPERPNWLYDDRAEPFRILQVDE
jgi:hypothetical protein